MIQYTTAALAAAPGASAETKITSGLTGVTRRIHLVGNDVTAASVTLTARVNSTTTMRVPADMNMGTGYWLPVEQDLTPQDDLYIGLDNQSAGAIANNVAIAYEDIPAK